jgi:hypothetical protein
MTTVFKHPLIVLDTWMLCSMNHMDMLWTEVCDLSSSLWSASVRANMRHDCPEMEPVCPEIKYHGLCKVWANPDSVHGIKDTWHGSYIMKELVPWWHSFQGTFFFAWRLGNNGRKGEDLCLHGTLWLSMDLFLIQLFREGRWCRLVLLDI